MDELITIPLVPREWVGKASATLKARLKVVLLGGVSKSSHSTRSQLFSESILRLWTEVVITSEYINPPTQLSHVRSTYIPHHKCAEWENCAGIHQRTDDFSNLNEKKYDQTSHFQQTLSGFEILTDCSS